MTLLCSKLICTSLFNDYKTICKSELLPAPHKLIALAFLVIFSLIITVLIPIKMEIIKIQAIDKFSLMFGRFVLLSRCYCIIKDSKKPASSNPGHSFCSYYYLFFHLFLFPLNVVQSKCAMEQEISASSMSP